MGMVRRGQRPPRHGRDDVGTRLRHSEARLQTLLGATSDAVGVLDGEGRFLWASASAGRLLEQPAMALVGTSPCHLVHPDDRPRVTDAMLAARREPGPTAPIALRIRGSDTAREWRTIVLIVNDKIDDPAIRGLVVSARDISDDVSSAAALEEAHYRFRATFEHAPIGMALVAVDGQVFRVNRALAQMLGRAADQLEGASLLAITHADDRDAALAAMQHAISGNGAPFAVTQRCVHADGGFVTISLTASLVCDSNAQPMYFVVHFENMSQREATDAQIAHQTVHDPLTGLPNRLQFVERLRRALVEHGSEHLAVLFMDLDHFKVVNDSLGHAAGDRLLVAVADRLRGALRPTDLLARFEGDQFTVLCTEIASEDQARTVATRLADAVAKPMGLTEGEVFVTASVGIAISDGALDTHETLMRNAEAALHLAKEQGRARAELYETASHDRAVWHLRTGNELHHALERGELRVHYQPIVRVGDGCVTGFEALIRWQHPERGLVGPNEFVELAEQTGLIVPIGSWVLEEACRQLVHWHDQGSALTMSVNLSPRQLAEPSLPDALARVLHASGVDTGSVWLEITESTLMRDAEAAVTALGALRAVGVHLSVDDFGTGYSSMAYLKRFPVDALKIDRTFVDGLGRDPEDSAICSAIVSLAHALGMRAVAEGVETSEQLAELRTIDCELAQGYLFGRPADPATFGDRPDR
jgi:diguanylate cyclase (GGDEF)-like protein/PAS domain S-box-containing protein